MSFLVDTNVISELRKPKPASAVAQFVAAQPGELLFTTDVTFGEIRFGIEQLEDPEVVQPTLGGDWIKKEGWTASRGRGVESAIAGDGLPPTRQASPGLELTDTSSLGRCLFLQQEKNTSTKRNQQRFAEKRLHNLLDEADKLVTPDSVHHLA